jgi:hypothetical protein
MAIRMDRRAPLVLLLLTLVAGPLLYLAFGRDAKPAAAAAPKAAKPASRNCSERKLAYGLSDDPRAGREIESEALFGAHPPLPRPGYYSPETTPDPQVVLHALTHRWVVVKYRDGVDASSLRTTGHVIVIDGGTGMPFALGAVAWGAQMTCATPDLGAIEAFTASSSTA